MDAGSATRAQQAAIAFPAPRSVSSWAPRDLPPPPPPPRSVSSGAPRDLSPPSVSDWALHLLPHAAFEASEERNYSGMPEGVQLVLEDNDKLLACRNDIRREMFRIANEIRIMEVGMRVRGNEFHGPTAEERLRVLRSQEAQLGVDLAENGRDIGAGTRKACKEVGRWTKIKVEEEPGTTKEEESMLVYQDEDFVLVDQGDVCCDAELLSSCRGLPVFTPDERGQAMTREWARETVRVLAADEILRPQILAGKLRFLGQRLSLVVKGARSEQRVFAEEDFEATRYKEKVDRLRELLVGRPVFLPEEGCEYALARRRWGSHLVNLMCWHPEFGDGIISGSIPVDGRRWTEIELPTLAAPWSEPGQKLNVHMFRQREGWRRSYDESRAIRVADFPVSKPDWAGFVRPEAYLRILRSFAEHPTIAAWMPVSVPGFYNEKHHLIYYAVANSYDV